MIPTTTPLHVVTPTPVTPPRPLLRVKVRSSIGAWVGLYRSTADAIIDALCRGARHVSVQVWRP